MNVSLTVELTEFVKNQVASGMYHSNSEVIREGLRLLREHKQVRQARLDELRKKIAVGIEQLDRDEFFTLEEVVEELRQRNEQFREQPK